MPRQSLCHRRHYVVNGIEVNRQFDGKTPKPETWAACIAGISGESPSRQWREPCGGLQPARSASARGRTDCFQSARELIVVGAAMRGIRKSAGWLTRQNI